MGNKAYINAFISSAVLAGKNIQLGLLLNQFFARYFNSLPYYSEHLSEQYLRDTINGANLGLTCTVWAADGTAEIEFITAEKGYTATCKATTTDGVVIALPISYLVDRYTITSIAQNVSNIKIYDPAYIPTDAEVIDLNLDGSQPWVAHQFKMEEGPGSGATDNVICFDRLNDGVYATITSNVSGSTWDTDKTIFSVNNALGYKIALGTEVGGLLEIGSLIPISATNPSLTVLGTTPTYLGKANYDLKLTLQNCVETTDTEYIQLDADVIDGNKWAFEIDLEDVDTSNAYNGIVRKSSSTAPLVWLKNNTDNVFRIRNNSSAAIIGTYDTSQIIKGKLLIVSNSIDVEFYHNSLNVDTLIIDAALTIDSLFTTNAAGASGLKGKASNTKIWDLSAYTSGQIDALDFDTLAPTNWFALNEYDEDLTLPATKTFYDKMGTGVTGVLTNGSDANISKMDGLSQNFEKGFNWAVVSDGVDDGFSIPLSGIRSAAKIIAYIDGNDSQFVFAHDNSSEYLAFGAGASGSTSINNGAGTPTYYKNDIQQFPTTRNDIVALFGGEFNKIEFRNVNLTTWTNFDLFNFAGFPFKNTTVKVEIYLDGANLSHSLISQSDGTLLDIVNDVTYTNQGTGSLGVLSIPASEITPTEDVIGVDLVNPPRTDQSEQNVKAIETAEFIDKDADEVFFSSGVAQDVNLTDIPDNDYISVIKNVQNQITDLRIKA